MDIEIDIRAKILPDDHRVYIIFPGRGYAYFDFMFEHNVAFLELPNIPFDLLDPSLTLSPTQEQQLNERLVESILLRRWKAQSHRSDISPQAYVRQFWLGALAMTRTIESYRRTLENFYFKIPNGSTFLLPAPSISGMVMIGEFEDQPLARFALPDEPSFTVVARRVKWLKRVERYKLNGDLLRRLSSPNPVRMLEQSAVKFVYDIAYGQYKHRDTYVARLDTEEIRFDFKDGLILNLFLYHVAEVFKNYTDGNPTEYLPYPTLEDFELLANIIEQRININSPGSVIISGSNILPFLMVAFFAASAIPAAADSKPTQVTITNSMQEDQIALRCNMETKAVFESELAHMGYNAWQKVCRERQALSGKMRTTATGR